MEQLPLVTPEIAKGVWDKIEKPSRRKVADRLNASGRYQPISDSAIQRWKQAGWVAKTDNPDQHRNKGPEEKLGQVLVVATGDPCADGTRFPEGASGEFETLSGLSLDVLQDQATRDRWATYILAQRMARTRLADPELKADQIAKMERALSGALKDMAAAQAVSALAQAKLRPPEELMPGDGAKVIEHDEFDDIMGAFRKAAAA